MIDIGYIREGFSGAALNGLPDIGLPLHVCIQLFPAIPVPAFYKPVTIDLVLVKKIGNACSKFPFFQLLFCPLFYIICSLPGKASLKIGRTQHCIYKPVNILAVNFIIGLSAEHSIDLPQKIGRFHKFQVGRNTHLLRHIHHQPVVHTHRLGNQSVRLKNPQLMALHIRNHCCGQGSYMI
ncbi:hypothetical protein D3C86_1479540 [compost metagenome]